MAEYCIVLQILIQVVKKNGERRGKKGYLQKVDEFHLVMA